MKQFTQSLALRMCQQLILTSLYVATNVDPGVLA